MEKKDSILVLSTNDSKYLALNQVSYLVFLVAIIGNKNELIMLLFLLFSKKGMCIYDENCTPDGNTLVKISLKCSLIILYLSMIKNWNAKLHRVATKNLSYTVKWCWQWSMIWRDNDLIFWLDMCF